MNELDSGSAEQALPPMSSPAGPDASVEEMPGGPRNPAMLAWHALLLRQDAFDELRDDASPITRGLIVMVVVLVIVGVVSAVGQVLGVLTSPNLADIQRVVLEGLQQMTWYRELELTPGFEAEFMRQYELGWQFFPMLFGAPSWGGAASVLFTTPIFGLVRWLFFGLLTFLSVRLLGGEGKMAPFLGLFALSYVPEIFNVIGLFNAQQAVVSGLVSWWTLATGYLAVRSISNLSWGRSLMAVILPRLVIWLLGVLLLIGGVVAGIAAASAAGG